MTGRGAEAIPPLFFCSHIARKYGDEKSALLSNKSDFDNYKITTRGPKNYKTTTNNSG